MEVSWGGEEEELMFGPESPSPQPQPDLMVDLSPNPCDEEDLTDLFIKQSVVEEVVERQGTTTMTSSSKSVVKKKKSTSRTESISVEGITLSDVFGGVSPVDRLRRSFEDSTDLCQEEGPLLHPKRPKSSLEEGSEKSSLSKLNMLEEKKAQASPTSPTGGKPESEEKKVDEHRKICKACGSQVFAMECLKAEKAEWHKTCFRCSICSKVLSVEAYSSHEGRLFCRPHFRELFQPKAVAPSEDVESPTDKTEVIIRESQPVPLPEGVIRASEPADKGFEDLHLDLKSKFELFEKLQLQEPDTPLEPVQPKRSGSVLAKLAKYQSAVGMDVGVPDEVLAGGHGPSDDHVSSDDEVDNSRKPNILDEINSEAVDSVRNKWAQGMSNRSEVITEHRKEEQSKVRSRFLLGKNVQLKEMYEKAVENGETHYEAKPLSPDEVAKSDTAKELKELFEKGDFKDGSKPSKLEGEVFESAITKQSRELFKELDKSGVGQSSPKTPQVAKPRRIERTESISPTDVIKSSDMIEEIVKPVDIGSKFKFFEEGGQDKKVEKKAFSITPPRDDKAEPDELEEVEIYRDPSIIRSSDSAEPVIPVTRTASKMLSVFRQLEQQGSQEQKVTRALKEFTPPREPLKTNQSEDDESEEEEQDSPTFKEDQLKEVGSLARASSLRAKFERWESEENERNDAYEKESPSIDSTKDLRAKFENLKREEEDKLNKRREVKVNRFVELTNSGVAMESCVSCEKRVYVMEKTEAGGKIYHKSCFRCSHCKCPLRMDTFTSNKGTLYCTPHFKQLFKIKGNYDEGFGHETQRIQWEKKKGKAEDKEN